MKIVSKREVPEARRWPRPEGAPPPDRPLQILVCDDEKFVVKLIQVNLEKQGHHVIPALNGEEGWNKILAEQPDIAILDIMMPYVDGFELLQKIRRNPLTSDIFVVMLTTESTDENVAEGYRLGADMYMTKPFTPADVVHIFDATSA